MKCPFCGVEMKKLVQRYPAKYNKPDLILWDHPRGTNCLQGDGHTLSEETWLERSKQS